MFLTVEVDSYLHYTVDRKDESSVGKEKNKVKKTHQKEKYNMCMCGKASVKI